MPARSKAQQMFMGAELRRKRAGKRTKTGMSESQLSDFATTKRKGLPYRRGSSYYGPLPGSTDLLNVHGNEPKDAFNERSTPNPTSVKRKGNVSGHRTNG